MRRGGTQGAAWLAEGRHVGITRGGTEGNTLHNCILMISKKCEALRKVIKIKSMQKPRPDREQLK